MGESEPNVRELHFAFEYLSILRMGLFGNGITFPIKMVKTEATINPNK
jgi:hypothetical protein